MMADPEGDNMSAQTIAQPSSQVSVLSTGFALFSMFFGAGNIVFSLAIGQFAKDMNIWALLGFLITAVMIPFIGVNRAPQLMQTRGWTGSATDDNKNIESGVHKR